MRSRLICGKPSSRAQPSAIDGLRDGPTVVLGISGEVLDPGREPRDAVLAEHFQLVLLERPRLALECHFAGLVPRHHLLQLRHQSVELAGAQIRRRPAAEIDVIQAPPPHDRLRRQQRDLLHEGVEIDLDFLRVLVRVNAEVAELTAFTAKRNVQVEPERHPQFGWRIENSLGVRDVLRLPVRERWVVGDEVVPEPGLFLIDGRGRGHRLTHAGGGAHFIYTRRRDLRLRPQADPRVDVSSCCSCSSCASCFILLLTAPA